MGSTPLSVTAGRYVRTVGDHPTAQGRRKPANGRSVFEEETRMISQRSTSARALVIISTTVAVFVLLLATAVHAMSTGAPGATADYRVHAGDTLWSIASERTDPGGDVRAAIAEIRDLNDLSISMIRVGDVLSVPASDGA